MSVVIALAIIAGVFTILYGLSRVLAPSFNYKGAHVLITGGSSGIGLESAKGTNCSCFLSFGQF